MEIRDDILIKVKDADLVNGTILLPNTIRKIDNGCFAGCEKLAYIHIPSSVHSIEKEAFCFCSNLSHIALSDGLESIGISAFRNCYKLSGVTFPRTLKEIKEEAFFSCGLTAISIPDTIREIENGAFACCDIKTVILEGKSHQAKISSGVFFLIEQQCVTQGRKTWVGDLYRSKQFGKWKIEHGWIVQSGEKGSLFGVTLEEALRNIEEYEKLDAEGYFMR